MMKKLTCACGFISLALILCIHKAYADFPFSFDAQHGPPLAMTPSACGLSADCIPVTCTNCNEIITKNGQAVIVLSYKAMQNKRHGSCQSLGGEAGPICLAYPNVECGTVILYGLAGCPVGSDVDTRKAYSGNCTP